MFLLDTFILKTYFFIMKISNFQEDLIETSPKKASLAGISDFVVKTQVNACMML